MTDIPPPPEASGDASAPEPTPAPAPAPLAPSGPGPTPTRRPATFLGRLAEAIRQQNWFAVALELAIVIAGVVIGFQVTAWGQARQAHDLETTTLRELRTALSNDVADLRVNAGYHERAAASAQLLREHLRARAPYADSLDAHFGAVLGFTYSVRDEAAYETLKQRGMETITDDSLRTAIGRLYGIDYSHVTPAQSWGADFLRDIQVPFYNAHFEDIRFAQTATPTNYGDLLDSKEFAAILDWLVANHSVMADMIHTAETNVEALILQLDEELATR